MGEGNERALQTSEPAQGGKIIVPLLKKHEAIKQNSKTKQTLVSPTVPRLNSTYEHQVQVRHPRDTTVYVTLDWAFTRKDLNQKYTKVLDWVWRGLVTLNVSWFKIRVARSERRVICYTVEVSGVAAASINWTAKNKITYSHLLDSGHELETD